MSYLTFGAEVQTVVIVNLDTTSKFTQAVRQPIKYLRCNSLIFL